MIPGTYPFASIKKSGVSLVSVENSALFNDANSETLTRTFGTPTDNNVWTYSVWLYITQDSTNQRGLLNTSTHCCP